LALLAGKDPPSRRLRLPFFILLLQTGALGYPFIIAPDLDNVGKVAGGEGKGMKESVGCFDGVFPEEIMGRVAIVAGRYGVVTAGQPRRIVVLHHVAIGAAFRIVAQVGVALGVDKSVKA
jgi:hypothetical protein